MSQSQTEIRLRNSVSKPLKGIFVLFYAPEFWLWLSVGDVFHSDIYFNTQKGPLTQALLKIKMGWGWVGPRAGLGRPYLCPFSYVPGCFQTQRTTGTPGFNLWSFLPRKSRFHSLEMTLNPSCCGPWLVSCLGHCVSRTPGAHPSRSLPAPCNLPEMSVQAMTVFRLALLKFQK